MGPAGGEPARSSARIRGGQAASGPVLLASGLSLLSACDTGGRPPEDAAGPPVHVVALRATVVEVFDEGVGPPALGPIDGFHRPVPTTAFHVQVDRYLDPVTASRQAVCLQSVATEVRTIADCSAGLILRPSYDPVTRTVTYYQESGASRLAPDTFYRLTVLTPTEELDFGLRAFDGAPLAGNHVFDFVTGPDDEATATEGPPDGALDCATLLRGPLSSCASGGCHGPGGLPVAMGLDLASPSGIEQTARGHVAHQTQRGPQATTGDQASLTFGRSMPIVAPGDPGRSYLLYKLLASDDFAADPTLASGETERLRQGVVVGMPMPPDPFTVPPPEDLADLVRWIAGGAAVPACP